MRHSIAVTLALFACATFAAVPETSGLPAIESAEPASRLRFMFPGAEDREALVILEFDVLANGRTANINLVDEGFHEKRFVDEAIRALKDSKWKPRRVNNVPVDSVGMRFTFEYTTGDREQGITREFAAEAAKVEKLISTGELAKGEEHASWMLTKVVKSLYEYAVLQAQLAQTYALMGRTAEALEKISGATARLDGEPYFLQLLDKPPPNREKNYLLSPNVIVDLLAMKLRLQARQGLALEAMQTYYDLAGLKKIAPDDPVAAIAAMMTERIRGTDDLRGLGRIATSGRFVKDLSRRRFTLENVQGEIEATSLVCEAHSQEAEYQQGKVWTLPPDWGLCWVSVRGTVGTTFEVVESVDPQGATSSGF